MSCFGLDLKFSSEEAGTPIAPRHFLFLFSFWFSLIPYLRDCSQFGVIWLESASVFVLGFHVARVSSSARSLGWSGLEGWVGVACMGPGLRACFQHRYITINPASLFITQKTSTYVSSQNCHLPLYSKPKRKSILAKLMMPLLRAREPARCTPTLRNPKQCR